MNMKPNVKWIFMNLPMNEAEHEQERILKNLTINEHEAQQQPVCEMADINQF